MQAASRPVGPLVAAVLVVVALLGGTFHGVAAAQVEAGPAASPGAGTGAGASAEAGPARHDGVVAPGDDVIGDGGEPYGATGPSVDGGSTSGDTTGSTDDPGSGDTTGSTDSPGSGATTGSTDDPGSTGSTGDGGAAAETGPRPAADPGPSSSPATTIDLSLLPAPGEPVLLTFASPAAAAAAAATMRGAALVTHEVVEITEPGPTLPDFGAIPGLVGVEGDGIVEGAAGLRFDDPCLVDVTRCLGAGSWYLDDLGITDMWVDTLGAGVVVAVVDGGVDPGHPELRGSLAAPEVDFVGTPAAAEHGTAVASLALARAGNGNGIAGVAPEAGLLSYRVLDGNRRGVVSDTAAAIVAATDAGADVVNLSLTGSSSPALESAVAYALDHDVVVVAAAGNSSSEEPAFPAALPGVIAVGATDHSGAMAPFSNRGSWVDVFAPGLTVGQLGLPVPSLTGGVRSFAGTSASAPIVAGIAALLLAGYPDLEPASLESLLRAASPSTVEGPQAVSLAHVRQAPDVVVMAPGNPTGRLDRVQASPGGLTVLGWALDPDEPTPIGVDVYVDGLRVAATPADRSRPDLAAAYPAHGPDHGFGVSIPVRPGRRTVCAYGINRGPGTNSLLGCQEIWLENLPFGSLDVVERRGAGLHVGGWALSPRRDRAVPVRLEVDGQLLVAGYAVAPRADVARSHPGFGADHGFSFDIPERDLEGSRLCVRAESREGSRLLGCRTI